MSSVLTGNEVTRMNLFQKINEVQKQVTSIIKDATIEIKNRDSYQVVTHDAVTKALHLPLANVGIVAFPTMKKCDISTFEKQTEWNGKVTVSNVYRADIEAEITFINSDDPSDKINSSSFSFAFDSGDKAIGKAYSMAIKTIYLKVFMLESLDKEESRETENDYSYAQKTKNNTPNSNKNAVPLQEPNKPLNHAPTKSGGLSEAQIKRFYVLLKKANWTDDDAKRCLKMHFGVEKSSDLSRDQYDLFCDYLQQGKSYEQVKSLPTIVN